MLNEALHISPRTLREWEQGRRKPSDSAKALIENALRYPEVFREEVELRGLISDYCWTLLRCVSLRRKADVRPLR